MYLIILGDYIIIKNIVDKLNKQSNDNIQYTMCGIATPCAELLDGEYIQNILINGPSESIIPHKANNNVVNDYKKYIIFDEGIETAQCLTYADILSTEVTYYNDNNKENNYMLMRLIDTDTYYKISYPILQLGEEVNPDDLISSWIINNNIVDLAKNLTIKPVNIVGTDHDILVFAAYINS
jgi:hypothetical protein